jgi:hypothetical protein
VAMSAIWYEILAGVPARTLRQNTVGTGRAALRRVEKHVSAHRQTARRARPLRQAPNPHRRPAALMSLEVAREPWSGPKGDKHENLRTASREIRFLVPAKTPKSGPRRRPSGRSTRASPAGELGVPLPLLYIRGFGRGRERAGMALHARPQPQPWRFLLSGLGFSDLSKTIEPVHPPVIFAIMARSPSPGPPSPWWRSLPSSPTGTISSFLL